MCKFAHPCGSACGDYRFDFGIAINWRYDRVHLEQWGQKYYELELGRPQDRLVGRFGAVEDVAAIDG